VPAVTPRRVFITGALGFIGSALSARLRDHGWAIRGVDRVADPELDVVAGDIAAPGSWQEHADGCELLVHTAAVVSNVVGLDQSWLGTVLGTRQALDAAERGGAQRFLHLSSVRAFSDLNFPDGVDERHPVRTDGNPYVDTKVAAEQVVLQAHAAGEVPVTVVRPGDGYGPRSRPWTILAVEAIKANRFLLPAMGKDVFSPVYIENLIDGLELAATHPQAEGEVFTISDGIGVSCAEFFGHYYRMLGRRGPVCVPTSVAVAIAQASSTASRLRGHPTEVNATTMRFFARTGTYSIEQARRVLGYEPKISLEEGIRRTEEWLRSEGLI
jgi:nucleoside-diphosphate-sugar epimerase